MYELRAFCLKTKIKNGKIYRRWCIEDNLTEKFNTKSECIKIVKAYLKIDKQLTCSKWKYTISLKGGVKRGKR